MKDLAVLLTIFFVIGTFVATAMAVHCGAMP